MPAPGYLLTVSPLSPLTIALISISIGRDVTSANGADRHTARPITATDKSVARVLQDGDRVRRYVASPR